LAGRFFSAAVWHHAITTYHVDSQCLTKPDGPLLRVVPEECHTAREALSRPLALGRVSPDRR